MSTKIFENLSEREEEAVKSEARRLCKEDLHYLAKYVLGYNRVTDHIHKRMARDIDTPKYRFKLLLWPRGHFKSTLGTEARSIQKLLRNPNERILITNAKLENSRRFLRAIAHHFNANARFRWLWREYWLKTYATPFHRAELKDRLDWVVRDTQDEFTVLRPYEGREASITTGAVDASLVSQHYSTILADDLINREYVRTMDMVEKSILYFKDLLDLLDPDGHLEIIGTRWAHMDLYNWIIEEFGGVASLRVPENYLDKAIVERSKQTPEDEKEWMISIQPCYDEQGNPIFPEEYSQKVLENLERTKGPYEFGCQYLLDPTPEEHQNFREEWFNKLDVLPDPSTLKVCITVDPAMSLEDRADNTAIAVYGYDEHNNMYLLDGRDEKMTTDELLECLFETVQKWYYKARYLYPVGFEAVGFQETYVYNLERMMRERNFFFMIEPIKRRRAKSDATRKEERILRLVPRVKNGFYVPRRLLIEPYGKRDPVYDLSQRLIWQLTKFPFAGKDDLADATADQLDIVQADFLPSDRKREPVVQKPDFVHPSIIEDRRRLKRWRQEEYNDAVR
jgi:Terminase-like family.